MLHLCLRAVADPQLLTNLLTKVFNNILSDNA